MCSIQLIQFTNVYINGYEPWINICTRQKSVEMWTNNTLQGLSINQLPRIVDYIHIYICARHGKIKYYHKKSNTCYMLYVHCTVYTSTQFTDEWN